MSGDWKPGDVALWDRDGAVEVIYHFLGGPDFDTPEWQTAHDGCGYPTAEELRPLVVIDPEDREQVERLLNRFMQGPKGDYIGGNADDLQAALRSLIAPPKPDEPTGLGAVVEATCACHPRVASKRVHEPLTIEFEGRGRRDVPWKSRCGHHAWGELSEVKVLSEGVTP